MLIGLIGAALAALCYGVGSVLQAVGARNTADSAGLDPRLFIRLARQVPYLVGLVLDAVGFLGAIVALRTLPLFLVQSCIAASVGVTAVTSVFVLHARLKRLEIISLVGLGLGLLLLAVAAQPEAAKRLPTLGVVLLFVGLVLLVLLGVVAARLHAPWDAAALAAGAGLGFGGVGIAARVLVIPTPMWRVVLDPVLWAVVLYGVLSLLLFATALQRGAVTTTSAITFAVETIVPALIGLFLLGDAVRSGFTSVAAAGFVLTLASSISLAKFSEPDPDQLSKPA